jgi:SAM-dependent methyltransferase
VDDYVRWRPGYPEELLDLLARQAGLRPEHVIADVGSGTGISTEVFLKAGHSVFAVEPNRNMAAAAEQALARYPDFRSVNGKAEATTLPDASIDWIVAAQAFHWFDVSICRREFARILRGPRTVLLLWNDAFFSPMAPRRFELDYVQRLDFDGLAGRLLSSSYMPGRDHERFDPMMKDLRSLFEKYQVDHRIDLLYATRLFVGGL